MTQNHGSDLCRVLGDAFFAHIRESRQPLSTRYSALGAVKQQIFCLHWDLRSKCLLVMPVNHGSDLCRVLGDAFFAHIRESRQPLSSRYSALGAVKQQTFCLHWHLRSKRLLLMAEN